MKATKLNDVIANIVKTRSTDEHAIYTPIELTDSVVSRVKLKGSILVIANVEWIVSLCKQATRHFDITFVTPCEVKAGLAKHIATDKNINIEILQMDWSTFFEKGLNMEFDVVLGNPPYQIKKGKTVVSVSSRFVKTGFNLVKEDGVLALVNSNVGIGAGQQSILKIVNDYEIQYMNPCALGKEHFPTIAQGISVYVIKKTKSDGKYKLSTENDIIDLNINDFLFDNKGKAEPYIPKYVKSVKDVDLLKKILSKNTDVFQFRSSLHNNSDERVTYFGFQTSRKITANPKTFRVSDGKFKNSVSHPCAVNEKVSEAVLKSVFCSDLFMWVIEMISGAEARDRPARLSYFPKIPLDKEYTADELYSYFGLTHKEIEHIESTKNT